MKTVSVRQAQTRFLDILRLVAGGEEVKVVERKKTVARIVPPNGKQQKVDWSDTWTKVDAIFGGKHAPGKSGSRIVIEGRR
jgi:antitoxin (DNA-binding transcriptional repressor) of toxin-antitoxin stability system